jgi:hypothetical protein
MPKTVLPSKFQEWKGLDRITLVVHDMKCIFREINKDDYGLDGEIEVVVPKSDGNGYETTGGIIKVQAKSGGKYVVRDSKNSFSTPVEKTDLEGWHKSTFPVLLIVYHPADDKLYWKEIRAYVENTPEVFKPPLHVVFNKATDEFTEGIRAQICKAAEVSPPRITMEQQERLYSNLFRVKQLPKIITSAPTDYIDVRHVKSELKGSGSPFTIIDETLYTLDDLRDPKCVLRQFCDTENINDVSGAQWAKDEKRRREFVFLLNQLFGSHLYHCGLKYNKHFKREYFPRENDTDLVFKRDWHNVRTGKPAPYRIVAKFYKYGRDEFWRHTAATISFKYIGTSWFLQIIPKYLFTSDGVTPCDTDLVGPYTTKIKAKEKNVAVLNHVLFWVDVLSQRKSAIEVKLHHSRTLVVIEKKPLSGIANFAIPYDPAIYEEEDDSQPDLFNMMPEESAEGDVYEF